MSEGLVIEITEQGRIYLSKASEQQKKEINDLIILNELSKTRSGMHYPNYFEEFNFKNPSLIRCRAFLKKKGFTTEHY